MLYDIQRDGSAVPAFTALQKIETPGYSWWPCPNLKQLLVQGLTSHRSLLELTEARYAFRWASVATAPEPLERLVIRSGQNFQFDYWVRDAEVINRLQAILAQKGGRLIMQHESRHYDGTRKVHEVSWPLEKDIN
ncbi:hypothetical protein FRC02_002238 [Tulasnella sp. 418]|nr:hypothetical protein FRC02_002238 [Tulasnella sp. 418]